MPTPTYEAIETISLTGSSSAATITFSSIPQTYTDLILVGKVIASTNTSLGFTVSSADQHESVTINNTTGGSYPVRSNGSASLLQTVDGGDTIGSIGTSTFSSVRIEFFNYSLAGTGRHKPVLFRIGRAASQQSNGTGIIEMLNGTTITSITLDLLAGNFASGTTFTLYGIE